MKNPAKLQSKLLAALSTTPALKIVPPTGRCWEPNEFDGVAWVVQDFVNQNDEVIDCDPLREWLDEYRFFLADQKGG